MWRELLQAMDKAKSVLTARVADVHKFAEAPRAERKRALRGLRGIRCACGEVASKPTLERLQSLVERNNAPGLRKPRCLEMPGIAEKRLFGVCEAAGVKLAAFRFTLGWLSKQGASRLFSVCLRQGHREAQTDLEAAGGGRAVELWLSNEASALDSHRPMRS